MLFSRLPFLPSWGPALRSTRQLPYRTRPFSVSASRYAVDMGTVNTSDRLARLRQLMQERKVDVYSMTSDSPFPNISFSFSFQMRSCSYYCQKLSRPKIAINPNILHLVMPVEVRTCPSALEIPYAANPGYTYMPDI